jgi:tripartite ATP-independent transporter DctM subunit
MLGLFIFIIMLGFPIAFTLIAMGVGFGFYAYYTPGQDFLDNRVLTLLVQKTFEVSSSDVLTAVPLFLFMGYVVERANILDRLFYSVQLAAKHVPGSLAVAALITCALFATATGIVGAVVTLMGLLAYPQMLKAGYDVKFSSGVICAGGCLGIMIPPSILLIVYAATAGVSAVKMYAAAMLPGFLLAGLYVVYVIGRAVINPRLAPKLPKEQMALPMKEVLIALLTSFVPLAVLIASVLGAILKGWATPSEGAGVGALAAIVLSLLYNADYATPWRLALLRLLLGVFCVLVVYLVVTALVPVVEFSYMPLLAFLIFTAVIVTALVPGNRYTLETLKESVILTARTTAMVCYLFIGSWTFSSVFSYLGGHSVVEHFILSLNMSPVQFLILTQIIIFLLGWPLEWSEIVIIFVPIFLPLLDKFGVDPILFGVLVALNIQTSFNTPPMAMAAYYLKGIAPPHVRLVDIFGGSLPFVFMVFICMALIYVFPEIALWLPNYLYTPR